MTAVTDSKPRANRHGDPCPPWCDVDHQRPIPGTGGHNDSHQGARAEVEASGDAITLYTRGSVTAYLGEGDRAPIAIVTGSYYTPDQATVRGALVLSARDAHEMAAIVEALADMQPAQLRQLAAGIRGTAEVITAASAAGITATATVTAGTTA